jgi:hypothetical protein
MGEAERQPIMPVADYLAAAVLDLPSISATLPLAEIYDGVDLLPLSVEEKRTGFGGAATLRA